MKIIYESKVDATNLYFHGSFKKMSSIDAPTYEKPFCVTNDPHYAMSFSQFDYSKNSDVPPVNKNGGFVYVVSLNQQAEFVDFRKATLASKSEFFDVFPKKFIVAAMNMIYSSQGEKEQKPVEAYHGTGNDIWYLGDKLMNIVHAIEWEKREPSEYENRMRSKFRSAIGGFSPRLEDIKTAMEAFDENPELQKVDRYHVHKFLAPWFEKLDKRGFSGIICGDSETHGGYVQTDYQVMIWNIKALEDIYVVPIEYQWLKRNWTKYRDQIKSDDYKSHDIRGTKVFSKIQNFVKWYKSNNHAK